MAERSSQRPAAPAALPHRGRQPRAASGHVSLDRCDLKFRRFRRLNASTNPRFLIKTCVLSLCLHQERDIRIGTLPQVQEVPVVSVADPNCNVEGKNPDRCRVDGLPACADPLLEAAPTSPK